MNVVMNSVDPGQTPRSAASDLDDCLLRTVFPDIKNKYGSLIKSTPPPPPPPPPPPHTHTQRNHPGSATRAIVAPRYNISQSAFYVNLYRAVIGPSG